jgi:hypothetical protein
MGKQLMEDEPLYISRWMRRAKTVEPTSPEGYFGDPFKIPNSDHKSIAKPADADAIQHRLLVQFIQKMQSAPVADR